MAEQAASDLVQFRSTSRPTSQELVQASSSGELFFAVVGHVGSGTSEVATTLRRVLSSASSDSGPAYDAIVIKASAELEDWDAQNKQKLRSEHRGLEKTEILQQIGNDMRRSDPAAVARALIRKIRTTRAEKTGVDLTETGPVLPDGRRRAYILDSIRHPAEVELLTRIYQDAFVLVSVVCDATIRLSRLKDEKFTDSGRDQIEAFMERDAKEGPKYGQRVSDAFHLAHYFLDNTEDRKDNDDNPNPEWNLSEQLVRLKKILTHATVVRPYSSETAMFAAYGAKVRSACLSRQVGASIVNNGGEVISLGTNEVPQAGGGVYGAGDIDVSPIDDGRCVHKNRFCSNTHEQEAIIKKVIKSLRDNKIVGDHIASVSDEILEVTLEKSPIGSLLEFSRAVHAEMDAVLSLVRRGMSAMGTRVFVSTFPCHYCARHLVAAGVSEVQFIEPYPKSKALDLHSDSITTRFSEWRESRERERREKTGKKIKVLFRPFVGVAPRLYSRAFTKTRDLKDGTGAFIVGRQEWTGPTHLGHSSYTELEAQLARAES